MPTFSKFISSQRGAQQILDSDGYIYSRKKSRDTALTSTWRCAKYNPPTKCKCHIYLTLADNSITLGTHPHNHSADDRGVRVIAFSTTRNMKTLAEYPNWIADGTFYVAPKIFPQSYTIHAVVDLKCLPLIYILAGDKKGDTVMF